MVIKITHTISQPVVDGDSITIGKDTIINETAYDVNGKMRVLLPMEMEMSQPKSMQTAVIRHLIMTGRTA